MNASNMYAVWTEVKALVAEIQLQFASDVRVTNNYTWHTKEELSSGENPTPKCFAKGKEGIDHPFFKSNIRFFFHYILILRRILWVLTPTTWKWKETKEPYSSLYGFCSFLNQLKCYNSSDQYMPYNSSSTDSFHCTYSCPATVFSWYFWKQFFYTLAPVHNILVKDTLQPHAS